MTGEGSSLLTILELDIKVGTRFPGHEKKEWVLERADCRMPEGEEGRKNARRSETNRKKEGSLKKGLKKTKDEGVRAGLHENGRQRARGGKPASGKTSEGPPPTMPTPGISGTP